MKKTIITGAGASAPYGFPTGYQLRKWICENIREVFRSDTWLGSTIHFEEVPQRFAEIFRDSGAGSIDLFLSRKKDEKDFVFLGKAAIAYFILRSEMRNDLYNATSESDYDDWYYYLYNRLTEDCFTLQHAIEKIQEVQFITFNYDRSLEYYFYRCLYNQYLNRALTYKGEDDFSKLPKIRINHIYGSLGDIKECSYPLGQKHQVIQKTIDSIKVLYDDRKAVDAIQEIIKNSDILYFLGFGFLAENVEKLGINSMDLSTKNIFATGRGLLDSQKENAKKLLHSPNVWIEDSNCTTLLKKYY